MIFSMSESDRTGPALVMFHELEKKRASAVKTAAVEAVGYFTSIFLKLILTETHLQSKYIT